jgi:hypothetical protein
LTDENLVELEIAAFQGPHIKRARIVLAAAGLLYVWLGYRSYDVIAKLRDLISHATDTSPEMTAWRGAVNLAYAVVVSSIIAGIAMFVLAGVAGRKTMLAFYAAVAVFRAHSLLELYASGGLILTSWVWWATAICLTLGFMAARKAEALRKAAPAPAI